MKTTNTKGAAVVLLVVILAVLAIQPPRPAQAADQHVAGAMGVAPIEELGAPMGELAVIASDAVEDTLKACMARIPKIATAGQRILAEQNCAGEEETRKAIRSAPKF